MLDDAFAFLGKALLVSVMLIFIILVAQFNSFLYPVIIGSTLFMGVIGVSVGLNVTNRPFGLMAFVGMISLFGIVVNNAIVLIDYILQLKSEGYPLREAVLQAGKTRFRPVLLTTITTILGLIPLTFGFAFSSSFPFLVYAPNNNTAFWGPMGSVVIFGLIIATFFTLVVVPTLFYILDSWRQQVVNSFKRMKQGNVEAK
jgi:multidrug efflux pump subunit AcrB